MKEEIIITNPLSPKNLYYLFFKPTKLFAPNVHLKYNFRIVFLAFIFFSFWVKLQKRGKSELESINPLLFCTYVPLFHKIS
jgi:hypothetical protein